MSELLFRPATELATLIHTSQISSSELVAAALERIEALQPSINAFTHIDAEGAIAAAEGISADDPRPFAGVPIAIKDTAAVAGMPYTMGSDVFGDFVPGHDAFVVRRIRDAGFVVVGATVVVVVVEDGGRRVAVSWHGTVSCSDVAYQR